MNEVRNEQESPLILARAMHVYFQPQRLPIRTGCEIISSILACIPINESINSQLQFHLLARHSVAG